MYDRIILKVEKQSEPVSTQVDLVEGVAEEELRAEPS